MYGGETFIQTGGRITGVHTWGEPTVSIGWKDGATYEMSGSAALVTDGPVSLGRSKAGPQPAAWILKDCASARIGGCLDFADGNTNQVILGGQAKLLVKTVKGLDSDGEYISFTSDYKASQASLTIDSMAGDGFADLVTKGYIRINGTKQADLGRFSIQGTTLSLIPTARMFAVRAVNRGRPPIAGAPFDVDVEVRDAENQRSRLVTDATVVVVVKSGSGTLSANTSMIPAGTDAFQIKGLCYDKAESVTLTATSDGLGYGDSPPFDVVPGEPAQLTFDVQPADSLVAGWPISPALVVAMRDAYGNLVDRDHEITVSSTTASLATDSVVTAKAEHGLAVFRDIKPRAPGANHVLLARSTKLSGTSAVFAVARECIVGPDIDNPRTHDIFRESRLTCIAPQGWLREFLQRQNSGLTGHRKALAYPFDTCLWAGQIPHSGVGADWWPYEQTAYLTDGLLRLGHLLRDDELVGTGRDGVRHVLSHPMAHGRLGHPFFASQWPIAVFFRAIQAEHSATHDQAMLQALRRHYLSFSRVDLARGRNAVNIEGMLWTYGKTGDPALLAQAEKIYLLNQSDMPLGRCALEQKDIEHGVTYMEEAKLPAILYSFTGKKSYLDAALNAFRKLDRDHMLPDGVPSSNELLAGKDPLQSHETCVISDYTWSIGFLLMATGDAAWADRIEKAIFNAGPGCVSKDFRSLQYFSSPNQVIATGSSNHNTYKRGSTWMAYWPCHETECCAGNVHRFMPNYAARMWMRDAAGGLVAALYAPSSITLPINQGRQALTVTENTRYPFAESITFTFQTPVPVKIPFSLRIPGWCDSPSLKINGESFAGRLDKGTFVTLHRCFQDGDVVELHVPMPVKIVPWEDLGLVVERGPLLFAFAVPEKVTRDDGRYANMGGKRSPDPDLFPALDIRPNGPWNYALATRSVTDLRLVVRTSADYPFDPGCSPVLIQAPARKVVGWALEDGCFTPPLPAKGTVDCEDAVETIDLVPYGSTRLRLAVFPEAP